MFDYIKFTNTLDAAKLELYVKTHMSKKGHNRKVIYFDQHH